MLTAIPGLNHLKIWKTDDQLGEFLPGASVPSKPPRHPTLKPLKNPPINEHLVHRLIFNALEVAAGRKPLSALDKNRYHPAVIRHLSARRKQHHQRGNATITSMHAHQANPTTLNVCGACRLADKTLAYAAKIHFPESGPAELQALRIL